jgi:RND family efflux transporter MFP subunit
MKRFHRSRTSMKTSLPPVLLVLVPIAALLSACSEKPAEERPRAVRTAEIRYDKAQETNRYFGSVQSRHEVHEAFRVGGKAVQRKVDVGQKVREGDVLAVLDDTDYRQAEEAARQHHVAALAQARQAESDRKRLDALKVDGSVSVSDDEKAQTGHETASATAEAAARQLELARNRLKYTVLRASRSGVVTAVRFEAGQVVAEGQPIVAIANEGEPEIVADVPEDHLNAFKGARYRAYLMSAPEQKFDVVLRELSPLAATTTRTYRARLRPATPRPLPLGASATLLVERAVADNPAAAIPASAITQSKGKPAVWVVRRSGSEAAGTVDLLEVTVHGYRNDEVLVTGPPPGELVVTAGVQKMAPGLKVALSGTPDNVEAKQAAR